MIHYRSCSHKTFEYDFCTLTRKTANQNTTIKTANQNTTLKTANQNTTLKTVNQNTTLKTVNQNTTLKTANQNTTLKSFMTIRLSHKMFIKPIMVSILLSKIITVYKS